MDSNERRTPKLSPPEPHTPEDAVMTEILLASIKTDEDYARLAELADEGE